MKNSKITSYVCLLLTFAVILTVSSCKKDTQFVEDLSKIDRIEFLSSNSSSQIKSTFLQLNFNDRKILWLSKFDQLINSELPVEHRNLIIELKSEYSKSTSHISLIKGNFRNIALKLAEITPRADFLLMFTTLNDYYFSGSFISTEICETCITEIKNELTLEFYNRIIKDSFKVSQELENCNCRWTCGDQHGACTTNNCKATEYGCGFAWLSPCYQRDILPGMDGYEACLAPPSSDK